MQANELRVGNLISGIRGEINTVLDFKYSEESKNYIIRTDKGVGDVEFFRPLTISEKWLTKLGFELNKHYSNSGSDWYSLNGGEYLFESPKRKNGFNKVYLSHNYITSESFDNFETPAVLYVHQLQNLYFALTGNELTLTPAKEEIKK